MLYSNVNDARIREILIAGDLLGEPALANRIAKRGGSASEFYKAIKALPETSSTENMLGLRSSDTGTYSLMNLVRSQMDVGRFTAQHERDVSALVASKSGTTPKAGEFVPFGILARDLVVGTSSAAGNFVNSNARLGEYVEDPLRRIFTLGRLGATFITGLSGTEGIPVLLSSDTAAQGFTETGTATTIADTSRLVTLTPRRLAVIFIMSRQAVLQSSVELEAAIRRQMVTAIDEALQLGVLAGDGAGSNPTGILNDSTVNIEVGGATGATLAWSHLIDMEYLACNSNVPVGAAGWVINPATAKFLRKTSKAANLPFILGDDNCILGAQTVVSNVMPATLTKSSGTNLSGLVFSPDWRELIIGIYGGGVEIVTDRVTLADQGKVRVIASLNYGFGLRQPAAFSVMKDAALV